MLLTKVSGISFPDHGDSALVHGIPVDLWNGRREFPYIDDLQVTYNDDDTHQSIEVCKVSSNIILGGVE